MGKLFVNEPPENDTQEGNRRLGLIYPGVCYLQSFATLREIVKYENVGKFR